jgi:hypothetical protein
MGDDVSSSFFVTSQCATMTENRRTKKFALMSLCYYQLFVFPFHGIVYFTFSSSKGIEEHTLLIYLFI